MKGFCLTLLLATTALAADQAYEEYFGGTNNEAYVAWTQNVDFQQSTFLPLPDDPTLGSAIHWNINDDDTLDLAVAVRASGWVGFGISENGGMRGADMMIFEAKNPTTVLDAYVQEELHPLIDDCQNWEFVNSTIDSDFLIVQVRRKLDTGDTQDRAIIRDANLTMPQTRIISAWGDSEEFSYHGPNRVRGGIRWLGGSVLEDFYDLMDRDANGHLLLTAKEYNVPAEETTYAHFCFTGNDLRAQGANLDNDTSLIGFEAVVENTKNVHHFLVYGSFAENNGNETCTFDNYFDLVFMWAPGDLPFALPDFLGAPLGGSSGLKSFMMEIHYDNPLILSNITDSSGVKMYYSNEPRPQEMGVMQIGDPFLFLRDQNVGDGLTGHSFSCPSDCSTVFADEPVTAIREWLHMHKSGVSMYNQQIRDNTVIHTGHAQFFDFRQTGGLEARQEPFQINPGDAFKTECFYRNDAGNNRTFGLGSSEEMCITFIVYYPRKQVNLQGGFAMPWYCGTGFNAGFGFGACDAAYQNISLTDDSAMERTFGVPSTTCSAEVPAESSGRYVGMQALLMASLLALGVGML